MISEKYDFKTIVRRNGAGSYKWDVMKRLNPAVREETVPLSVADMEFKNAPEITEGLKEYIDGTILGYAGAYDAYYEAVTGWMKRRHGFAPVRDWFVETEGVVPALRQMIRAFTSPSESVLIMTPVYYPFRSAVRDGGRGLIESRLIKEGDSYAIDFDDFESKAKREDVSLFILCSPHNPVGRVWTKEELLKISRICLENKVYVISDEIHFDIIMPAYNHFTLGGLEGEYLNNTAICTSPSKSFNLAGLQLANIFVPDKERRKAFISQRDGNCLNILSYKACEIAYNRCESWLNEMIDVVDENRLLVEDYLKSNIPQIKASRLEGTYLQWLDLTALGLSAEALEAKMIKAELFFDEGYIFGEGGSGFERVNLACPKRVIEEALERLKNATNGR